MYRFVNVITCEITDKASVCAFFMDFNETVTVHIYSLRGSNMCQTNYFIRVYYVPGGALVSSTSVLMHAFSSLRSFETAKLI